MKLIVIELPLPPAGCSPNGTISRHWTVRSKAAREYRQMAWAAGYKAKPKFHIPYPIRISHAWYMAPESRENAFSRGLALYKATGSTKLPPQFYRPKDIQNAIAALKSAIDGLVDAGIVPDDTAKWVSWGKCELFRRAKEHQGRSCVVLTLEEIE